MKVREMGSRVNAEAVEATSPPAGGGTRSMDEKVYTLSFLDSFNLNLRR